MRFVKFWAIFFFLLDYNKLIFSTYGLELFQYSLAWIFLFLQRCGNHLFKPDVTWVQISLLSIAAFIGVTSLISACVLCCSYSRFVCFFFLRNDTFLYWFLLESSTLNILIGWKRCAKFKFFTKIWISPIFAFQFRLSTSFTKTLYEIKKLKNNSSFFFFFFSDGKDWDSKNNFHYLHKFNCHIFLIIFFFRCSWH